MNRRVSRFLRYSVLLALACGVSAAQDVDSAWQNLIIQGQYAAGEHDYARAGQIFERALHEAERFGAEGPRVANSLKSLGLAYQADKRFADAESSFRRALKILDKGDVAESVDSADINRSLASTLIEQGKQAAAVPLLSRSLSIYSKQMGGGSLQVASVHCMAGDAYRSMKSWQEAEASLKRCAEIREADGGMVNSGLGDALYSLAQVYEKEGKYALADPRYKLVEKIREKTQGIMSPGFADVLESHAALLKAMGRDKEASQDATLAAAVRRRHPKN